MPAAIVLARRPTEDDSGTIFRVLPPAGPPVWITVSDRDAIESLAGGAGSYAPILARRLGSLGLWGTP